MTVELVNLDYRDASLRDRAYQRRKSQVAALAQGLPLGGEVPDCPYSQGEHALWRRIRDRLGPLHRRHAPRQYLEAIAGSPLDRPWLPQMREVSAWLEGTTGFELRPAAGFVSPRDFLANLARGRFLATQFVRHEQSLWFSAEPDYIHEILGHAVLLSLPFFAELSRSFGRRSLGADPVTMERIARVYWYSVETGVVLEDGEPKAYGSALLSSIEELSALERAQLRPFDPASLASRDFVPTLAQPRYHLAGSQAALASSIRAWFDAGCPATALSGER